MDRLDITYEITFPQDLNVETAGRLFASLSGLFKPVGRVPQWTGRPTLTFEILATPQGIHYLVSFPPHLVDIIQTHLQSVIPSVGFERISVQPRQWNEAIELTLNSTTETLDPKLIPTLLGSLANLHDKEAVLVQFVVTPIGNQIAEGGDWWAVGRLAVSSPKRAVHLMQRVRIGYRALQVFKAHRLPKQWIKRVNQRATPLLEWPCRFTGQELAIICGFPLDGPQIPGLVFGKGRKLVPSPQVPASGVHLGTSNYPSLARPVAVESEQLLSHAWILGPTNSGKSTLLHNMGAQLMDEGHGLVVIEPKGDLARDILASVPAHRMKDVIWFDPTDTSRPIGLNVLAGSDPERTTGNVVALFKSLYGDSWGPRLEQILKYSVLTAAENNLTLYDVKQLLVNQDYRATVLRGTKDHDVRQFWRRLEDGPDNAIDSVVNKLDAFVGFRAIRNVVGQTSGLDLNEVAKGKILLVPLNGAALGEANASMLGSLIVDQLWRAVRIRKDRKPVFLMLDEFQRFLDLAMSMESAFAEARGFGLGLIVANQTTSQLSPALLAGIEANALTQIGFAMSPQDSRRLEPLYSPLRADDLHHLGQYEIAARLMTKHGKAPIVTAVTSKPFDPTGFGHVARELSRRDFGRPAGEVEAELASRHQFEKTPRKRPSIGVKEDD